MKNIFKWIVPVLLSVMLFSACDNNDDADDNITVSEVIRTAFSAKYPSVNPHWENDHGYYKAEFRLDGREAEAWFDQNGIWQRTEVDYNSADLPQPVKDYINNHYAGYRIDDANLVQTKDNQEYFDIELEKGEEDVYLKIDVQGNVIK